MKNDFSLQRKIPINYDCKTHALDILEAFEEVNPECYPKPTKEGRRGKDGVVPFVELKGSFLTREQFATLYNRFSQVLHTDDPFSIKQRITLNSRDDFRRIIRQVRKSQSQIIRLLTHHQFVVMVLVPLSGRQWRQWQCQFSC